MPENPENQADYCTIPPVKSNYEPKGRFETINNLRTYIIGEKTSEMAIVVVQGIFGIVPSIQQDCDALANQGFYVIMPDFLGDQALLLDDVPFDTPEKVEKHDKLFAGAGNPKNRLSEYLKFGQDLKDEGFTVGGLGYCWGAKIASMADGSHAYTVIGTIHPSTEGTKDGESAEPVAESFNTNTTNSELHYEAHAFTPTWGSFSDSTKKGNAIDNFKAFLRFGKIPRHG